MKPILFLTLFFHTIVATSQTIEHEINDYKGMTINDVNSNLSDKDKLAFILFINTSVPNEFNTLGKWSSFFNKLTNKHKNIFELHVYKYKDITNRVLKISNIPIHSSSLFILANNTFDTSIDSSGALFYTKIVDSEKDKFNLTYFEKTTSKVCGEDVEFNNLQKPVEELVIRYKEFLKYYQLNLELSDLKRKIVANEHTDSINKHDIFSIKESLNLNNLNSSFVTLSYSIGLGNVNTDLKQHSVLSQSQSQYNFTFNSSFENSGLFNGFIFGINVGTSNYEFLTNEFSNSFLSKDKLGISYNRTNYYSNWRETIKTNFIEIPVGLTKTLNFKNSPIINKFYFDLGATLNLLYINSIKSEIISGNYSTRAKYIGVKDELNNIPELGLVDNKQVNNTLVWADYDKLKISGSFQFNVRFKITRKLYANSNLVYTYYPNLFSGFNTDQKTELLSQDILSSIAFASKFSLQPFRFGLGLSLKL